MQFSFQIRPLRLFLSSLVAGGLLTIVACSEPSRAEDRLMLVKENMNRGDYGAASLELANLIQSRPNHLEARLLQGKVSLAAGRAAAAEAQLKYARELGAPGRLVHRSLALSILAQGEPERITEALGSEPADPDNKLSWLVASGMAALHAGQTTRAQELFVRVMKLDDESLDGQLGMASVQRAKGDLASAAVYIENANRAYPLSIAAWQALGSLRYEQGRLVDAERAFINAIEGTDGIDRSYEHMLARVGLVETQWHLDKKSEAVQDTKDLMDNYPWHPLPKYLRGLLAFLDGEYDMAGDYLYRVVSVLPDHQPSLKLLAAINSAQGKLGRAQLYLDKYFALNANDPEMVVLLAETYLQMGNAEESVATMSTLIDNNTDQAKYLDLYGTACRYAASCTNGEVFLSRAVDIEPENLKRQTRLAAAYLNRGDLASADALMRTWVPPEAVTEDSRQVLRLERFLRSGQYGRATEYAKKLRRKTPANLHALLALAEVAYLRGETSEETAWLELARERNPSAVEPRMILAHRHIHKKRYQQAVHVAQEAASAHPYNANILRVLAHALINIEQYSEALSTATEARRLAPSQMANRLTLIHAHLVNNDRSKARSIIEAVFQENRSATPLFAPMIIEMHQNGQENKARETLELLATLGGELDVIAEITGDLFLLEEEHTQAHDEYTKALTIKRSSLRVLKARLAEKTARRS